MTLPLLAHHSHPALIPPRLQTHTFFPLLVPPLSLQTWQLPNPGTSSTPLPSQTTPLDSLNQLSVLLLSSLLDFYQSQHFFPGVKEKRAFGDNYGRGYASACGAGEMTFFVIWVHSRGIVFWIVNGVKGVVALSPGIFCRDVFLKFIEQVTMSIEWKTDLKRLEVAVFVFVGHPIERLPQGLKGGEVSTELNGLAEWFGLTLLCLQRKKAPLWIFPRVELSESEFAMIEGLGFFAKFLYQLLHLISTPIQLKSQTNMSPSSRSLCSINSTTRKGPRASQKANIRSHKVSILFELEVPFKPSVVLLFFHFPTCLFLPGCCWRCTSVLMRGIAGAVCFFMGLFVIIVLLIVILVLAQIAEAFVLGLGLRLGIFVGLGEQGAGLAGPGEYLIDEFEDLVVFDFAIDEVEVVLVLDVAEDVQSRAAALEDGVESHLVVVEFAGVQHHVFHD